MSDNSGRSGGSRPRPGGGGRPGGRPARREFGGRGKYVPRRKVCGFCVDKVSYIDYKDIGRLRRYVSDRGRIEPRRKTGTCAKHQRALSTALKRARFMALLPYTADHVRVMGGMPPNTPQQAQQAQQGQGS